MQQLRFYSSQWLNTEQQDSDYLQLHNDRTTLLLTNLQQPAYQWPYTAYVLLMMGEIVTQNM